MRESRWVWVLHRDLDETDRAWLYGRIGVLFSDENAPRSSWSYLAPDARVVATERESGVWAFTVHRLPAEDLPVPTHDEWLEQWMSETMAVAERPGLWDPTFVPMRTAQAAWSAQPGAGAGVDSGAQGEGPAPAAGTSER